MRTSREEWRKRVERWKDSGLTAQQYAAELGIKASTLQFWKYTLSKPAPEQRPKPARARESDARLPLVELQAVVMASTSMFELELNGGRRLRIPSGFDAPSLERLLEVVARTA
jgi:hypothetical protein